MRDRIYIFTGLALFVGLLAYPFWHALAAKGSGGAPQLQLPETAEECVAARDFMRTSHMQMLLDWRDRVVRHQQRSVTAADGQMYRMSLANTCVGACHTSKAEFCDSCHTYAAVASPTPYCWDCHQDEATTATKAGAQ